MHSSTSPIPHKGARKYKNQKTKKKGPKPVITSQNPWISWEGPTRSTEPNSWVRARLNLPESTAWEVWMISWLHLVWFIDCTFTSLSSEPELFFSAPATICFRHWEQDTALCRGNKSLVIYFTVGHLSAHILSPAKFPSTELQGPPGTLQDQQANPRPRTQSLIQNFSTWTTNITIPLFQGQLTDMIS